MNVTFAGTVVPFGLFRMKLVDVTDAGAIASLNCAVTTVELATPVAPESGETVVTVGGVRSTALVSKTTSTQ